MFSYHSSITTYRLLLQPQTTAVMEPTRAPRPQWAEFACHWKVVLGSIARVKITLSQSTHHSVNVCTMHIVILIVFTGYLIYLHELDPSKLYIQNYYKIIQYLFIKK